MIGMFDKPFKEISWQVDEPTYRADPAISYSTLARFKKEGFDNIEHLYDKTSSPSLTFGSMVDTLLTDGQEAFDNRFFVASYPDISDTIKSIVNFLVDKTEGKTLSLSDVPAELIIEATVQYNYGLSWKEETRINKIVEQGYEYFDLLLLSRGKEVVSSEDYEDAKKCVETLRESPATKWYFQKDNPFEDIERLYQLKFKGEYNGISVRCMSDLLIVDHKHKRIIPCDLKTSSHPEWRFYKSFVQWCYYIQASLYWYIIRQNMDKDPYFKDFVLEDYVFLVVNRKTLSPKAWQWKHTKAIGDLTVGNYNIPNWRPLLEDLDYYLKYTPPVPKGIVDEINDIEEWLINE